MHGTPYCAFAGLPLPHFFGDRPSVAALSVQVLHDVFVARFIAVLAQFENILAACRRPVQLTAEIARCGKIKVAAVESYAGENNLAVLLQRDGIGVIAAA
jgi:hypothetical protein